VSGARIYKGRSRDCSRIERNQRPNSDTWASGRFITRRDIKVGGAARYSTEAKHPTPQQANCRGGDDKMPVDRGRTYPGISGELDTRQTKYNVKESCGSAWMEVSRAEHPETPGRRSDFPDTPLDLVLDPCSSTLFPESTSLQVPTVLLVHLRILFRY
jgi:hypothetical protein